MTKHKFLKNYNRYHTYVQTACLFYEWLEIYSHYFNHQPIKKGTNTFCFEWVTKQIYLKMDFKQMEAMLVIENSKGDIYNFESIAYIGCLSYNKLEGYYDSDRTDQQFTYYPTFKELLFAELFKPIMIFCNTHFIPENSLYLFKNKGWTSSKIALKDDENHRISLDYLHEKVDLLLNYYSHKSTDEKVILEALKHTRHQLINMYEGLLILFLKEESHIRFRRTLYEEIIMIKKTERSIANKNPNK